MFIAPLFRLCENQTNAGGKTYAYFFTPESSVQYVRSGHSVELSAVFAHPEVADETGRVFDATFSKTMRKMWVQFAKTGNPSLSADISPDGKAHEWPVYDTGNREMMVLDEFDIHTEKEAEKMTLCGLQSFNIRTIKKFRKKRLFQLSIPGMIAVNHSPSVLSNSVAPMMKK